MRLVDRIRTQRASQGWRIEEAGTGKPFGIVFYRS